MIIESSQNKIVKYINSIKIRKDRDKQGVFIAEGIRFVSEIPQDFEVKMFGVSQSFVSENDIEPFKKRSSVYVFTDNIFKTICDTTTPQGIIAVCYQKKYDMDSVISENEKDGFYILAEELNDPGNLGTIIRTADACGVKAIFLSKGSVDLYNSKVLRSTMGSVFHIPVFQNVDIDEVISKLHEKNVSVLAAHLKGREYPYSFDLTKPCGILIGNEARGLSQKADRIADCLVKIPMVGQAESLNASVAAAVLMYEVVRQRII